MCQHGHYFRRCSFNEPGSGTGTGLLLLMTTQAPPWKTAEVARWCIFINLFVLNEILCICASMLQHHYFRELSQYKFEWNCLQAIFVFTPILWTRQCYFQNQVGFISNLHLWSWIWTDNFMNVIFPPHLNGFCPWCHCICFTVPKNSPHTIKHWLNWLNFSCTLPFVHSILKLKTLRAARLLTLQINWTHS